jgi:hypothetical protein
MAQRLTKAQLIERGKQEEAARLRRIEVLDAKEKFASNPNVSALTEAFRAVGYVLNKARNAGAEDAALVSMASAQETLADALQSYGAPVPALRGRNKAQAPAA